MSFTVSLDPSWWWLWGALIAIYVIGVILGLAVASIGDDFFWRDNWVIFIWPLYLIFSFLKAVFCHPW